MTNNIYQIKKGEKFPIYVQVKNLDEDSYIDLTGSKITLIVKDELKDDFAVIKKIITESTDVYTDGRILNPELGEFVFSFTDEDYDKLVVERIYYMTIWWELEQEDFSKVISSNGRETLKLVVCIP